MAKARPQEVKGVNKSEAIRSVAEDLGSGARPRDIRAALKEQGIEVSAALMFAALSSNDNVGLCLFTDRVEKFIRPQKGRKHVHRLLSEMLRFSARHKKTDISKTLHFLSRVARRRGIIFVVSDCISAGYEKQLRILHMRHDVVIIQLTDDNEQEFPDVGFILVEDEESGEQVFVDSGSGKFKDAYLAAKMRSDSEVLRQIRRSGVDSVQISTSKPFIVPLRRFFSKRVRRFSR